MAAICFAGLSVGRTISLPLCVKKVLKSFVAKEKKHNFVCRYVHFNEKTIGINPFY